MRVLVHVPSILRTFSDGQSQVEVDVPGEGPAPVAAVFERLASVCVGVRDRTLDEHGILRRHVNVFVNRESVRDLDGMDTLLRPGDEIWIIPAVSGGERPYRPADQLHSWCAASPSRSAARRICLSSVASGAFNRLASARYSAS